VVKVSAEFLALHLVPKWLCRMKCGENVAHELATQRQYAHAVLGRIDDYQGTLIQFISKLRDNGEKRCASACGVTSCVRS
jgi:hypothetical protein